MFTGIIEEVGTVRSHEGGELVIGCDLIRSDAALGDSIAVNGVDLTVRTIDEDALRFDVMNETYRVANLSGLQSGDAVNLDIATTAVGQGGFQVFLGTDPFIGSVLFDLKES